MRQKMLEYTKIKPLSIIDSAKMMVRLFKRTRYVKEDDSNYVRVKYEGMIWNLRYSMLYYDLGILLGTHEYCVLKWVNFKDIGTFVDAGAYIGTYTLRAAKYGAIVYSFEPNPYSFKLLTKNVKDNNFTNVHLYNLALFDKQSEMDFSISTVGSSLFGNSEKNIRVKTVTLDSFNLKNVDMLKVDVEDAEINVIMGANKTLENTNQILIEVRRSHLDTVDKILNEKGFSEKRRVNTNPTTTYILYEKIK